MDTKELGKNVTASLVDQHITGTRGDRKALRYGESLYTFHDMAALMNRTGNMLRDLGVQPNSHILLPVPPSPALIAGVLGAMKIGSVPVMITGTVDRESVARCIAVVKPSVIVVHQTHLATFEAAGFGDTTIVVVGKDTGGHRSFAEIVRESASSLSGVEVAPGAPVLALFEGAELVTASHAQVATLLHATEPNGSEIESWALMPALHAFASCEEVALPVS